MRITLMKERKTMRHAYLLMVHEYNIVLERLLESIDDKRNDIFIHVDKKTKNFPFEKIKIKIKLSGVYFIPRIKVYWGGYSFTQVEVSLLKNAINKGEYRYLHLLSGADLILKSQDEIYKFFIENDGKEFVSIHNKTFNDSFRVNYYFIEKIMARRDKTILTYVLKKMHSIFLKIQKLFLVKRNKNYSFYKDSNWFSITYDFAKYIVEHENEINKRYKHTFCSDEIFLQSLIMNSPFKNNIYKFLKEDKEEFAMRYIDWERGTPYTFKKEDYNILLNSNLIFARKFSEKIDQDIIELIYNCIKNKKN